MAFYDDVSFAYDEFWRGREYEHHSEIIALEKLLSGKKITNVADIGGGYGRLTKWLAKKYDWVSLVEPAAKMRALAKKYLSGNSHVLIRSGTAGDTNLPAESVDLAVVVRVIHHLPNPAPAIVEMHRILKPGGWLVLEFANSTHFLARVNSWLHFRPILPVPVERRSPQNVAAATIPFVNHHPRTVLKLLWRQGFKTIEILSVSNLRHPIVRKIIPPSLLLGLESAMQKTFAGLYFGPSIFILARKDLAPLSGVDKSSAL